MSVKSEVRYQKRVSVVKAIQSGEPVALVARIFQVPVATIYPNFSSSVDFSARFVV